MKTYTRNDVYKNTLEYFRGDELATTVWINKYALKNSAGDFFEINPSQMHERIAKELSRIEEKYPNPIPYETIYKLLDNFEYLIPGGSGMSGIGNDNQVVSLSNCFVIGENSDSYGSIMKIDEEQVQLMKRRGGVGHDLSHIRPKGSPVLNSALTSTGVVPFMERYSNSTREVAQDGRRGALMLSISINHPDAENFIDAKLEQGKVTGANISVKITDEFMKAVNSDEYFYQTYPTEYTKDHQVFSDIDKESCEIGVIYKGKEKHSYIKKIDAKKLWDKIIHNAWKSAEPGIMFWDTMIRESVPDLYSENGFKSVSTNPCVSGNALIATDKGEILMKDLIEMIQNGEILNVLTLNETTKQLEYKEILDGFKTKENTNIIEIETEDNRTLRLTPDHKVYTENRGWIDACKLTDTDVILSF
jgi:ribonucleoside-diphosphate reductase alpha chain